MIKLAALLLMLGLGVGVGMGLVAYNPATRLQPAVEWLDKPRELSRFRLDSINGSVDNQSLKGQWTIVSFGFLHCADICPTSLSQLANLSDELANEPVDKNIKFIFVSVDPNRDAVEEVNDYARHFDTSFDGVTGTTEQLKTFASGIGIQFDVSTDVDNYVVAHSMTFSIIDDVGVFRGRFRPGFDVQRLTKSLSSKIQETSTQAL